MDQRGFLWIGIAVAALLLAVPASASAARQLSIHDAQVTEPDTGQTVAAKFKVTLSKKSDKKVSADFETSPDDASGGSDYVDKSGTVKIKPHRKSKTIKVTVNGDDTFEGAEGFFVTLSNPHGAAILNGTATGTIQDNDPDVDSDADGIPDSQDECPNVAAPDGFCPATAYDIAQGIIPIDNHVTVSNLLVTAKKSDNSAVWAQIASGDAGFIDAAYSGLKLTGTLSGVAVGDRITVKGIVSGAQGGGVSVQNVNVLSSLGETTAPFTVSAAQLSPTSTYENVLVELQNVQLENVFSGDWLLSGSTATYVNHGIIGTLPTHANGTDFSSIVGIGDHAGNGSDGAISPRTNSDITVAPLALQSFSLASSGNCMPQGETNYPIGSVTLNSPAPSDTVVTLQSSDPNVASVPGTVTVTTGQTSAPVVANGIANGDVTLTAALNTTQLTQALHVGPCQPPLVVNEVDYDQPGTDTAEFVEIYNPGSSPANLTSLALVLVNGAGSDEYDRVSLSSASPLAAGGYLIVSDVAVTPAGGATELNFSGPTQQDRIQNGSPDAVALIDTSALRVIDSLSYEGSITNAQITGFPGTVNLVDGTALNGPADGNTFAGSLSRLPNGADTHSDAADWNSTATSTPGAANTASVP